MGFIEIFNVISQNLLTYVFGDILIMGIFFTLFLLGMLWLANVSFMVSIMFFIAFVITLSLMTFGVNLAGVVLLIAGILIALALQRILLR